MKMITAVIKHVKLDDVRRALMELGITGMTVMDVKGFGRQKGYTEVYRSMQFEVRFLPKLKLEIAVSNDKLEPVIEAIKKAAGAGEVGDGKIFVHSLEQVVRIRTGETGEGAL